MRFIAEAWQVASAVLRLDPAAYQLIKQASNGLQIGLFILIVSSFSYTVGQVAVLFANRVTRKHFLSGLAGAALTLMVSTFFWSASIWLTVAVILDRHVSLVHAFAAVAASFAPLLFGFMILIPYLGNILFYVLRIWAFLAVIVGTAVTFEVGFWQAVMASALGWIVLELLTRIPFLQINRISNWLWRVSTGTAKQLKTDDIVTQFLDEGRFPENNKHA